MTRRYTGESPARRCEACFLNEAVTSVGTQIVCEECAYEHAWAEFLAALQLIRVNRPMALKTRQTHTEVSR